MATELETKEQVIKAIRSLMERTEKLEALTTEMKATLGEIQKHGEDEGWF